MWRLGARGELAPEPGSSRIYLSARPPPIDRGQEVASRPAELKPGAASPAQSVTKWVTALSKAGKYPRWVLTSWWAPRLQQPGTSWASPGRRGRGRLSWGLPGVQQFGGNGQPEFTSRCPCGVRRCCLAEQRVTERLREFPDIPCICLGGSWGFELNMRFLNQCPTCGTVLLHPILRGCVGASPRLVWDSLRLKLGPKWLQSHVGWREGGLSAQSE